VSNLHCKECEYWHYGYVDIDKVYHPPICGRDGDIRMHDDSCKMLDEKREDKADEIQEIE
jgi:hypothetical protein